MAQETVVAILSTTPPRVTRFRKTLVVDKRRAFTELLSSFERTERGVWSYGRPLGTTTDSYSFRFFSSEQVDQILRDGAKRGRGGSHAAIERILKLEPEVKRAELWRRIRHLKYPRVRHVVGGACGARRMIRSLYGIRERLVREARSGTRVVEAPS